MTCEALPICTMNIIIYVRVKHHLHVTHTWFKLGLESSLDSRTVTKDEEMMLNNRFHINKHIICLVTV